MGVNSAFKGLMKRVMGGTNSMHGENAKRDKILVGKPELKRQQRRN